MYYVIEGYMSEEKLDQHLIEEFKNGNKAAFDSLVLKYQYKVFKLISRYISDPSEVLDITQESFIKAYNALDKFRGDSAFYTWLYRIAVNTAKNHLLSSSHKLAENVVDITDFEQFLTREDSTYYVTPERLLTSCEMEESLFEAIDKLPHDLKNSIMLREIEGMSYDDIAKIMKCPIGTVRSRIFRARQMIEKNLAGYMDGDSFANLDRP
jgi:RNA polymerase sigma-70 factor (ECF subfamily)